MTTITAKVISHSFTPDGREAFTVLWRYPRSIHSEVMTHRVFSRNASSSRAIPVRRLIRDVLADPFVPTKWYANKPGMQGGDAITGIRARLLDCLWLIGMYLCLGLGYVLMALGAHKQHVNRILEPWAHINVLVTSVEWDNFFALRDHPDAEPHIQILARVTKEAFAKSKPRLLIPGEWHTPFWSTEWADLVEVLGASVARSARTSYTTHDGMEPKWEEDLRLFERLSKQVPMHASPMEHQITPDIRDWRGEWKYPQLHGNMPGWIQYRQVLTRRMDVCALSADLTTGYKSPSKE